MKCFSWCALMLMLVIALNIGAADEPHDLSSLDQPVRLEAASAIDDLKSLSKAQLLSFHTEQVADFKKQVAALKARLDGASRLAPAKNDELGEQTGMQERNWFGGVMAAGSSKVVSSGFEKELGEVALVSDPELYVKSTLEKGDKVSNTIGLGPSACSDPFIDCNPALCEGQTPGFSGGLNCPTFASTDCPDDLSGLSYLFIVASRRKAKDAGNVYCGEFSSYQAARRLVACYRYENGRICTKPAFMHPHNTARDVVAIMLKRLVCSDNPEKCFTHKMGYCISNKNSNQDPYFSSSNTGKIQYEEFKHAYKKLKDSWNDIFDTENGGIQDKWACDDHDLLIFKDALMAF